MARDEQRERSLRVRKEILETAYQIGMNEGFEALSVRKIINEMQYSTGIIYHHFKDKQEILDAIELEQTDRLKGTIQELIGSSSGLLDELRRVFYRILQLAMAEPELYQLVVMRKYSRGPKARPEWVTYLAQRFKEAMERGTLRTSNPEHLALTVWSSFLGFNLMMSSLQETTREDMDFLFETQFNMMLYGILKNDLGGIDV